nr:hypothetical protein [Tanacetum cinerariifolium]
MLNKENNQTWSSRLLWYVKSRPNGKLIHNSILNGPNVRKMIPEPGDANYEITVTETFHLQTDDELSNKEIKQIEADDQAIQTILLSLPKDIYAAEKKAKLFNEWERFNSNEGESIESYYNRFLKLMNDLKRNKHFPEKIASNLKFLNNLQPEWSRHVTIIHQTKDLHTTDYTQLYDFLKYNQKEVDELKAQRLAKTQNLLALMANSNNPYVFPAPHQDQSSFNHNYLQQPIPNPEDITDPTTAMNMALALMQYAGQNAQNQAGYNDVIGNQTQLLIAQKEEAGIQLQAEEYDLMAAVADLDEIKEVNTNCILMANLQLASTSGVFVPQTALSREELYFSNNSKMVNVSKSISIPNEDFSDDTTPSVARKFLNEVKSTIVTLQRVVKQRIAIETHNWSSSTHQELHKNEAAKFVGDFKSLANEADASLAKHKALELEIKRLLKEVVSQDIMIIVKNESVVDTSYLQTELERTKDRFEKCIIKKETEYSKLWND